MYNYRLQLQYDGGRYDGWVRMGKDSNSNTIECKIKEIIQKMTGEDIDIYVGCRTEKGVHALNQTANFKLNDKYQPVEVKNYLNRYLPRDIAVNRVELVDERFHSQLNAREKEAVSACSLLSVIPSIMLIITHIIPITIKTIATVPIISPLIIL